MTWTDVKWATRICALLVLLGVAGGVRKHVLLTEREPPVRSDASCASCVVLDVDLHTHTRYSDGFVSPMELVLVAQREGLHAFAVTEHNVVFPAKMARWFSELIGGPTVLIGEEITSRDYHLIAVGIREDVEPRADLAEVIEAIHEQGGVAIAAHPTKRYWPALRRVRGELDGSEVLHPAAYGDSDAFSWHDMVDFFEEGEPLTAVGSSDFHFFDSLGLCTTEVIARERSAAAITDALRAGETRVRAPDGRVFGKPGGIAPPPSSPAYAALDALDAISRLLGWLGVTGLLIFRRRRKPA